MTNENNIKIRVVSLKVLQCESSLKTNIVGLEYIRMHVEIDIRKPIPTGLHKLKKSSAWIQFSYERLTEFCYKMWYCESWSSLVFFKNCFEPKDQWRCPWLVDPSGS